MTRNEWYKYLAPVFDGSDFEIIKNSADGDKSLHIHKKGTTKPQQIEIWCMFNQTNIVLSKDLNEVIAPAFQLPPIYKEKGNKIFYNSVSDSLIIKICNKLVGKEI